MLYHILAQGEIGEPVQALWETVGGLTPMLRQELADMPRQQSKTLDALLRLNGAAAPAEISRTSRLPLNVVTAQLGRLKEARYVTLEGGGKGRKAAYRVADQMFSVWYWMRYVPVARRRIELFTDFLRAWFSSEERRRLFQERWERFHANQSRGFVGMARRSLQDAEYYAASLDDPAERLREMERIGDAYVTVGDLPSAAGLFAEISGVKVRSAAKFESMGYSVLTKRLVAKGDLEGALRSCFEALAKDPGSAEGRADLGMCLLASQRYAEAKEQFDRIPDGPRLNGALRSLVLFARGIARAQLGDPHGAIGDYTAVVDLPSAPAGLVAAAFLGLGLAKGHLGDLQGAIADYTRASKLKGAPAEQVARALVARGIAKGRLGDLQGTIVDCTAVVELKGASAEGVAAALLNRGVTKGQLGDSLAEIADYTAVVELEGASVDQVARALLNRGVTKGQLGDPQGEIADYTAIVELKGASVDQVARALVSRGIARGRLRDLQGAIADQTAVVELKGAPPEELARALFNRGVAKGRLGDPEGATADYTAVTELSGAPVEGVARALVNRGIAKSRLDDPQGAIADYTAVVELKGAPPERVARALVNRGIAKRELGELRGAIEDYTRAVELEGAPAEQVAEAVFNRGVARGKLGDRSGAMGDYTALVDLKGAPTEMVAEALTRRGAARHNSGQYGEALADFNQSLGIPGLPEDSRLHTLFHRGQAHEKLGKTEEALADHAQCARSGLLPFVHYGLQSTVRLLLSGKRADEALAWVRRFHELEPPELSLDTRLQTRLDTIRVASAVASLEDASQLVDALLETDPEELRVRLKFLKPGLELARTNDESVLAKLPEEERKMAREIARSLAETARQPVGQPPLPATVHDHPSE
jgi:tetratricopeptide (TPR) repeat protein